MLRSLLCIISVVVQKGIVFSAVCVFLFLSFTSSIFAQDLTVTSIDNSNVNTNTQTLTVSGNIQVDIANLDMVDVQSNFEVTAFEDRDGNGLLGAVDLILGDSSVTTGLAGNASAAVTISVSGTVTFAGNLIYIAVDSLDSVIESDETNNIEHSGSVSQFEPTPGPFSPSLEWSWTSSSVEPAALNIMMTPTVIDLTGDGVPEVIFGSTASRGGGRVESGYLRALNGRDGTELFTVTDPNLRINTAASLAAGDIDLDGSVEIIASDDSCTTLIAFEHDGTFKWRSDTTICTAWGAISIADLDRDGIPEILNGREVFDNNGNKVWSGTAGQGSQSLGGMSLVADVDLDGENEVVAGHTVYDSNGNIKYSLLGVNDGYNAIGDFDGDDFAEIVHVTGGRVRLYNHDGSLIWGPVVIPGGGAGGPPTIADYDNDGEPEIGVAGARRYAVFETDGTLRWQSVTRDTSSNRTGSSVFDFEGDGVAEVVYRDETRLRVYRGTDGQVLFETDMSSCTWHEYVLVADVDADGNAEIVAVANNNCGFGPQQGVFIFGASNDNWVATRKIWNQHTYHITNINGDGSIPAVEQNNWQLEGLNNYRLNEFLPGEGQSTNAPDLTASYIRFDQSNCPDTVEITARIGNGGSLFVPAGVAVSFYNGDPQSGGTLIRTANTSLALEPGQFEDISIAWNTPVMGNATIYVVADDDGSGNGAVSEGDESNNSAFFEEIFCIPACIDNLDARVKRGKIQLTWTHVPGSEYIILRGDNFSGAYSEIARTTSDYSTYLDDAITLGQTYYYQIQREPGDFGDAFCLSDIIAGHAPTGRRTRMAVVPDVIGLTEPNADTLISNSKLMTGSVTTQSSDTVPEGFILAQDPPKNSALPEGLSVNYVVSLGSILPPNNVPSVDAGLNANINEGDTLIQNGSFIDPDADTWTATVDYGDGAGAQPLFLTPAKTFELNHTYADDGAYAATVAVNDGSDIGTHSITVTVNNVAPTVSAGSDRTIDLNDVVSLSSTFNDVGMEDTHTASIDWGDGSPIEAGVVSESNGSGTVTASHTYTQAGIFTVIVTVSDDDGGDGGGTLIVNVVDPNIIPVVTSTPVTSATESIAYSYDVDANDADGDSLSYSLSIAPTGMSIDAVTGLIQWVPSAAQVGDHFVQVDVDDGRGGVASQSFTITVDVFVPPNQPPIITSTAILTATEDEVYNYDVEASDPDGDALTYSLNIAPSAMSINSVSGLIAWAPSAAQVGANNVEVRVDDGNGGSDTQAFTITVSPRPNEAPVITSTPVTNVVAGDNYQYDVEATDADGDTLSYSLTTAPGGMSINASTGLITWLPGDPQVGGHAVEVQVNDGNGGLVAQGFTVTVSPAQVNQPPTITSTPVNAVVAGDNYQYDVEASDPDGDTVTFSLNTAPIGMSIDAATGLVAWIPDDTQVGDHTVEVRADDGNGGVATQTYVITVTPAQVNQPPVITSTPGNTVTAGDTYQYDVEAFDPDGDTVTFGLNTAPSGMSIDTVSGLIAWIPGDTQVGGHAVEVQADDGNGGFATQSFTITVTPAQANQPPTITSAPVLSGVVDVAYQYDVEATDPDGDALTYSLTTAPAGMSINASSGLIAWTPAINQAGSNNVVVRVSDAQAFAEQTYTITVSSVALPLDVFVQANPAVINQGEITTITVSTTGGTGAIVSSLTINSVPTLLDSNGQVVITGSAIGGYELIATAFDAVETITARSFFSVRDPADSTAPVATINTPTTGTEITSPVDIIGTASDANLIHYRLLVSPAGENNFTEIAYGRNSVSNGVLGQFDPTVLSNGQYDVGLIVRDANGQESSTLVTYQVTGDLKVGNFSFTVEDLNIPMAGIPISVRRTYDSRNRTRNQDFGFGWAIDYQSGKIQESRNLGENWEQIRIGGFPFPSYCIDPIGEAPRVTVTFPDGEVETFEAAIVPRCNTLIPRQFVNMVLRPVNNTSATMVMANSNGLFFNGNTIFDGGLLDVYDPDNYTLTRDDGTRIQMNQNFGIQNIQESNGNSISFSSNGIVHSAGLSVTFNRDAQGRITSITDPMGEQLQYNYDARGDLSTFVDRENETTRYVYNRSHGLLDIFDPRGVRVTRNIYDDAGRLIAIVDPDGNRTEISIDVAGRTQVVTDRRGNSNVYVYDDNGNVLSQTNALGETVTRAFNNRGDVLSQTDALGNTTNFSYDSRGNQLSETNALGEVRNFSYNSTGLLLTERDTAGNVIETNAYSGTGNLLSTADVLGNTTSYSYDSAGNVTNITDALGNTKQKQYDSRGNVVREVSESGAVKEFDFDANGNTTQERILSTDSNGTPQVLTRDFEYDRENRVTREVDSTGNETLISYEPGGRESILTDVLGRRTESSYDATGNLTQTLHPDGSSERFEYDEEGNAIAEVDREGRRTTRIYDAANRLVQTNFPGGASTSREYDAAGRLTAFIDESGARTQYGYDVLNRRISETNAQGGSKTFTYDNRGFMTSITNENGFTTQFEYDNKGQKTRTIFANGSSESTTYDALGRRTSYTDQAGRTTAYAYDAVGNLTSVVDPAGNLTAYTYNELNHLTSITDANGNAVTMDYDLAGRVIQRELPLGQVESFTYDAAGNAISKTDFNGTTVSYSYDSMGRTTLIGYPGGRTTAFTYTATGQRASVSDTRGTITYAYDNQDRLVSVDYPNNTGIRYQYDAVGNKTQVRVVGTGVGGDRLTTYTYNALRLMTSVTDPENRTTNYEYDAVGNRTRIIYPNGIQTRFTYDELNRITVVEVRDAADVVLSSFDYDLNAAGQWIRVSENGGRAVDYSYGPASHVIEERLNDPVMGLRNTTYTYDAVGNRLRHDVDGNVTNYTYDANDRLLSENASGLITNYTYDNNGNMLTMVSPTESFTFLYNEDNYLVNATTPAGTISYGYDADGIRQSQIASGVTTLYLTDPNQQNAQVLMELDASLGRTVEYTYGLDLISQQRGLDVSYYQYDALGSTRQLTDNSGAVTDAYYYSAFGELDRRTGTTDNNYLFAGEQYDPNIDKYYLRARYMDTRIGRFISADPFAGAITDPKSLHKYQYADYDPVNNIDPSGNFTIVGINVSLNIRATLSSISIQSFRAVIRRVITGVIHLARSSARFVIREVRRCIRTPRRCRINLPIISTGFNIPQTSRHILDAQIGRGSSWLPSPALLSRRNRAGTSSSARRWYNATPECSVLARATFRARSGTGGCDEYPYFSSFPGGPAFYPVLTSLRLVSNSESWPQALQIRRFYNTCRIGRVGPRSRRIFLAFGIPILPNLQWCGRRR